ncbi:MAG TPA: hypothetical protein PKN50_05670 [Spirochaetota bacterium]|nr:hypothetical protein [Spirochaetota bacterium]
MLSCASRFPERKSWEGIENDVLRVYVYHDYTDDFDGRNNSNIRELLQDYGKTRAETLLLSYIRLHVNEIGRTIACQQLIPETVARGTMRHFQCDTSRCAAYIDFNIRDFLEAAGYRARQ